MGKPTYEASRDHLNQMLPNNTIPSYALQRAMRVRAELRDERPPDIMRDKKMYLTNPKSAEELWRRVSQFRTEVRWDIFEEISKPWL